MLNVPEFSRDDLELYLEQIFKEMEEKEKKNPTLKIFGYGEGFVKMFDKVLKEKFLEQSKKEYNG